MNPIAIEASTPPMPARVTSAHRDCEPWTYNHPERSAYKQERHQGNTSSETMHQAISSGSGMTFQPCLRCSAWSSAMYA